MHELSRRRREKKDTETNRKKKNVSDFKVLASNCVCVCVAIKFAANIEFKDVLAFRYSENENIVDIYTRIVPIPINKTS